jgi:cellulose synthase (UDP-forming)
MVDPRAVGGPAFPAEKYASLSVAQRALVIAFVAVGLWYLAWRPTSFNPDAMTFSIAVYAAEVFGFNCALLYLTMCWRLKRRAPLPVPAGLRVAVFVPTINESVDIVRRTLLAALRMEHADEVWLLDDGDRLEMHALAEELGCRYLARTENSNAKAGNLNNALRYTRADLIAIFDADHAPMPNFLQETLGFFVDERVAFVQTPQDFYNLDSFQHRLNRRDSLVWSEQTLFFRVIQPGKDRLNSAFFCGSCAVIRRKALDDIGGFATGTVTEDIHTSIRLHKRGWGSVYYARSLAFGLAPASAIPFLKQRLRWGQGAMQVWRREGIVFTRGLTLRQRLSYLATVLAYFEGWQRAVFFLSPVIVLTTGVMPILFLDREFLIRFVPYYLLTFWVFEEVARGYGRSLLTEQYTMMRFAVFITATFGFFLRKLRFVVTPKRMGVADATRRTLWPQFVVAGLNAAAIPAGILFYARGSGLPTGALVANLIWAGLALGIAGLSIRFALRAARFRRREYRFPLPIPLRVYARGAPTLALATDISPLGCRMVGEPVTHGRVGDDLKCELLLPSGPLPVHVQVQALVPASGRKARDGEEPPAALGCAFRWGTTDDRDQLETFLFGSDLQWRLNGLEDRIRTPLERVGDALRGARHEPRRLASQQWLPLLYRRVNSAQEAGIGFISAAVGSSARTVVSLGVLPENSQLFAEEVTANGPRGVVGRVAGGEILETHAAPIYLYRLTA